MTSSPTLGEEDAVAEGYTNPEMHRLFRTYTDPRAPERGATADSLSRATYEADLSSPIVLVTSRDIALYPGEFAPPSVLGFRLNIGAFNELAGLSHLGPAVATLVRLKQIGWEDEWRADARRLLSDIQQVRAVNHTGIWERMGVSAFVGREPAIARMTEYACALSERYLDRALSEEGYMSVESVQRDLLIGGGPDGPQVPFNKIMTATFSLVGLDTAHRLISWLRGAGIDWGAAIVAVAGRQGRPTGGVTKSTNVIARILSLISEGRLRDERFFIAPHLPTFETPENGDLTEVAKLEEPVRWQLARVMSTYPLSDIMYPNSPPFVPPPLYGDDLAEDATGVTEMPRIKSPEDWRVIDTRLRMSLEDSRQLLASGVTDYMAEQLVANDNDPARVVVIGLDDQHYPEL